MEEQDRNPFQKRYFNLTEQGRLYKEDPKRYEKLKAEAVVLDAEEARKQRTRTLNEFNRMDTAQKLAFISKGGEVVGY